MTKSARGKAGKAKVGGVEDNRKPKHSLDANRPSSGKGGMRDAATVSNEMALLQSSAPPLPPLAPLTAYLRCLFTGSPSQDVQAAPG